MVANSFYGVVGSSFSRFCDRTIAESVTLNGQWLIMRTIEEAEKLGMQTIYADTDSLFVKNATRTQFESFVNWCNTELYPKILAEAGCTENFVKLAYEKQFNRIVFTGAKRYAGTYVHYKGKAATADSKPEVKGLEYKRGDAALLGRKLQEQMIHRMIVEGEERAETFREMLATTMQYILHDTLPVEEVQISKGITKPLKEYVAKKKADGEDGASPPHVRVAKILAERGQDVQEGTRIAYVVLDGEKGITTPIPASDYDGTFDRYYLWENLVYPPTQRLLQAAFPDHNWVSGLEKIRPPRLRVKAGVDTAQLGLALPAPTTVVKSEFVLPIRESMGEVYLPAIKAMALRHPGNLKLTIHVQLESESVAVISTPLMVSGSIGFILELETLLWEFAASKEWETDISCAR